MHLHEYQAKKLFTRYCLPVPFGFICTTTSEAEEYASKIGTGPWVVKCQVHAGGRGKTGGVKVFTSKKDILLFAEQWLGNRIVTYQTNSLGQPVNHLLIEAATDIMKELYIGAVIDRSTCSLVFIASAEGGVDIENVSLSTPHLIYKVAIDPITGPQYYQGRELAFNLGLCGKQIKQFCKIFINLTKMFIECDLELVEVNPLVINSAGDLICLDAKLNVDSNALFRQKELCMIHDYSQEDEREVYATKWELNYVALNGNIGCMVNGAGLAMGTMDIVKLQGGEPANFLDVGGAATEERVAVALKLILSENKVKAVLVNIFGGIVSCDLIAKGIIGAIFEVGVKLPVVVRLAGNKSEIGAMRLANSGLKNIIVAISLTEAAQKVVSIAA